MNRLSRFGRALLVVSIAALPVACNRCGGKPAVGGPAGASSLDKSLQVDGLVLRPTPVRSTVSATGSIVADESVDLVGELSRRLIEVRVAEGAFVSAGQLLFKLDDADLLAQRGTLNVRRALAAQNEARRRGLVTEGMMSREAYDTALTELQLIDAQLAELEVTLRKTEIRAPFAGVVGLRQVSPGAWITPNRVLASLQAVARVKVDFTLPERYAAAVLPRTHFAFHVAESAREFYGEVIATEPQIDSTTRSLLVRGRANNPDSSLRPGAFVTVEIPLEETSTGILVPAQAIIPTAGGHAVFVLVDGHAELRDVELGQRTASSVQLLRGVALGETVLTSNLLRLRPGALVTLTTPADSSAR